MEERTIRRGVPLAALQGADASIRATQEACPSRFGPDFALIGVVWHTWHKPSMHRRRPTVDEPNSSWPTLLDRGYNPGYTGLVKTAISIPDEVFDEAEETAAALGISRSDLYTQAVRQFLSARRAANIKASYDAAFAGPADEDADVRRRAARKALLAVEWNEKR